MSVSGQRKLNTRNAEMLAQRNIAPSTLRKCPTRVCVDSVSTTAEKTGEIVNATPQWDQTDTALLRECPGEPAQRRLSLTLNTSVDITQYGQLNQNTIASVKEILIISVQTRTIIKTFVVIFLVTP